jgi:hypothetical protein
LRWSLRTCGVTNSNSCSSGFFPAARGRAVSAHQTPFSTLTTFRKGRETLEDCRLNVDCAVVTHTVLAQEIQCDSVRRFESYVFHTQRAAAHSISRVLPDQHTLTQHPSQQTTCQRIKSSALKDIQHRAVYLGIFLSANSKRQLVDEINDDRALLLHLVFGCKLLQSTGQQ